jgi:hypothetical protein
MIPVTIFYRLNEQKQQFEFNHIENNWINSTKLLHLTAFKFKTYRGWLKISKKEASLVLELATPCFNLYEMEL